MNTFSEIIIWITITLYVIGALVHIESVGRDRGSLKPATAAANVLLIVCAIAGLLFVLWSNR